MSTRIINPGGVGFVIDSLYAYVSVHPDGDEGIIAQQLPNGFWMPLVAADEKRLQALRPYADIVVREAHLPVRLLRFSAREVVAEITP